MKKKSDKKLSEKKADKIKLNKTEIIGLFVVVGLFLILIYMIFILDVFASLGPKPEYSPPMVDNTLILVKGGGALLPGETTVFTVKNGYDIIYSVNGLHDTITITDIQPNLIKYVSTKYPDKETITLLNSAEPLNYPEDDLVISLFVDRIEGDTANVIFSTWEFKAY